MSEELTTRADTAAEIAPVDTPNNPGEGESIETTLGEIYDAHTTPDDEQGGTPAPAEQQATDAPPKDDGTQQPPAEQPEGPKLAAPHTWSKEEKAAWDAAPEQVKQALSRRAEQVEQYAQTLMETKGFADVMRPIGQTLAEMRPYFEGISGPDGRPLWGNTAAIGQEIKALSEVKTQLMRNPVDGLRSIINWGRQQGYDMGNALAQIVQDAHGWQDSATVRAQADAERHRMRAEALERQQQEINQQQHYQQQVAHVGQSVSAFTEAKDAAGNPMYPHLHGEHAHGVGELAGRYIRANVAAHGGLTQQLFQEAYNAAIWNHPQARAAEQKRLEDARVAQYKTNSQRARNAAGVVPSSSGTAGLRVDTMTQEEAMEAVWARHKGA